MSEFPDVKVLTWNIRSGGGKKCLQIIERILAHDPQVVVLTEFHKKNEGILRGGLEQGGYSWFETSNPQDKENGLLVASKYEITKSGSMTHDEDPQRWLSLYLPGHKIHLLAVHIPGGPDHKFINGVGISGSSRKEMFWKKIIEFAKVHLNDKVVIVGDFNTGFKEDAEGTPFILSKYMKELLSLGYFDAWRTIHKNKKEYTWYSQHKVNGVTVDKNGFRLDYIFLSPTLSSNVCDAFHSHQERLEKVSDHSVLACHFSFTKDEFVVSPPKLIATNNNKLHQMTIVNHINTDGGNGFHSNSQEMMSKMPTENEKAPQILSKGSSPPKQIATNEYYLQWRNVAKRKGVLELFDYFICQAGQRLGLTIEPWKSKSITLNITGKPVIKIFPRKCTAQDGLWLGYKDDNLKLTTKKTMPASVIPKGFTMQDEGWQEGYVNSIEQIHRMLSVL